MQDDSPSVGEYMTEIPATIETGMSLGDALDRMYHANIRHLPVVNERGTLVGLLSTRDIAVAAATRGFDPTATRVEWVMAQEPFACEADTSLLAVVERMERDRMGSVVVTRGSKPVGIFTTTDALRALRRHLVGKPVEPLVHPHVTADEEASGHPAVQHPHIPGARGPSKYDAMVPWFLARLS